MIYLRIFINEKIVIIVKFSLISFFFFNMCVCVVYGLFRMLLVNIAIGLKVKIISIKGYNDF